MDQKRNEEIWRSPRERRQREDVRREGETEFPQAPVAESFSVGRRDFLRAAGFVVGGATIGCGQAPVQKAIPYLVKPEEITPGKAYHYASVCGACPAGCGLLVKNRDGRPIKLEGLDAHPLSQGGLCAVGQASILGLYDSHRFEGPQEEGRATGWEQIDGQIPALLRRLEVDGGALRLVTGTIHSPTLLKTIHTFLSGFSDARHVMYDPLSSSAISEAYRQTHGRGILPHYRFDRARVIVGMDADFLGTWISPVEYTSQWKSARHFEETDSQRCYHAQFEARVSLTGTKADRRFRVAESDIRGLLSHLAQRLARRSGHPFETSLPLPPSVESEELDRLADRLWEARGESLVVCGSQSVQEQILCHLIHQMLGSEGVTLELDRPSRQRLGNDRDLQELLSELEQGRVGALLIADRNPVYELPGGKDLAEWIRAVPLTVSFAQRSDETSGLCRYVCPGPHYLEAWGDSQPVQDVVALQQPCIQPLTDSRALLETLAVWSGDSGTAYERVRMQWRETVVTRQEDADFEAVWQKALQDGFYILPQDPVEPAPLFDSRSVPSLTPVQPVGGRYSVSLYPKPALLDGSHAYNAWLQELPDPVTKMTWDNYACLSPHTASVLQVAEGDVVRLTPGDGGETVELPVVLQPGQHDDCVAVALGYGGKVSRRFAGVGPQWLEGRTGVGADGGVGVNVAGWLRLRNDALRYGETGVEIASTGRRRPLAATQTHHTITVPEHLAPPGAARRPVAEEITLAQLGSGHDHEETHASSHGGSLWEDHPYTGHRWGMVIDLDACTGCSACVVACQVENNIPVVGRDEVQRRREMHWLRIDRYYSGTEEDPRVFHQPMLCQHCENAPCETVCPVLATVHSDEGLNQQVYNRCVGTRYCANNCPYKVRRFNWFDYAHDDPVENLVLNPDVTVRSRGVMEKCSFCVQRIQEAKIEAKRVGAPLQDGAVRPACAQSCPADAIHFGDINDPDSRVSRARRSGRAYRVLEEINVRPSVTYLKVVRDGSSKGKEHG